MRSIRSVPRIEWWHFLLAMLIWLGACSTVASVEERQRVARELATDHGWKEVRISSPPFVLQGYLGASREPGTTVTIYIEGDGLAWLNRSTASDDPTPLRPMGLELAVQHDHGKVAYLARPCQFMDGGIQAACTIELWTNARFSEDVIISTEGAIDQIKNLMDAKDVVLVGYSGGAAIAVLVASRRHDVVGLVTVAGNLDSDAWTRLHQLSPLAGSLNPADVADKISQVPQVHFVGAKDTVVDPSIVQSYLSHAAQSRSKVVTLEGFDHSCCWAKAWPELQRSAF